MRSNNSKIKAKPLYILENDLTNRVQNLEDIKKYYSGEVVIISWEEARNVIESNGDVNIFLCIRIGGESSSLTFQIFHVKSGEMRYYKSSQESSNYPAGVIPYYLKKWDKLFEMKKAK